MEKDIRQYFVKKETVSDRRFGFVPDLRSEIFLKRNEMMDCINTLLMREH